MKPSVWRGIIDQWRTIPPVMHADLSGKTIIVTGANIGLGLETAKHFARMNPGKLVLACRSEEKGLEAVKEIRAETGCQSVYLNLLDLADFDSVRAFVDRFEKENERLDILVENAALGTFKSEPQFTKDGWEITTQVNHLSPSLLGILLLPLLITTGRKFLTRPRIVVVTSGLHEYAAFEERIVSSSTPLRDYGYKDNISKSLVITAARYSESKLHNVYFARALHTHLPPQSPLIVNSVTPGLCYSGLRREITGLRGLIMYWLFEKPLAWTSEEGSRAFVFAALSEAGTEEEDKMKGVYVGALANVSEVSDRALSEVGEKEQAVFWDDLVKELNKVDQRVGRIVKEYLQ